MGKRLQSVQIRKQILNLLLVQHLAVSRHLVAAHANNVGDAIVIGRHPAHRQELFLEDALHAWALPSARRIRRMASITVVVINMTTGRLLRIKPEFGVALAALDVAGGQRNYQEQEKGVEG